jgi:predicted nucleic acid-binding protein
MSHSACRANCLDASALVKIYISEAGSDILRAYLEKESTKYTTPFCFYEALNVLKVMWLYRDKKITKTQYLDASFELSAWYSAATVRMKDLDR